MYCSWWTTNHGPIRLNPIRNTLATVWNEQFQKFEEARDIRNIRCDTESQVPEEFKVQPKVGKLVLVSHRSDKAFGQVLDRGAHGLDNGASRVTNVDDSDSRFVGDRPKAGQMFLVTEDRRIEDRKGHVHGYFRFLRMDLEDDESSDGATNVTKNNIKYHCVVTFDRECMMMMHALPADIVLRVMALLDPSVARMVSHGVRDAVDAAEVTGLDMRWRGRPTAKGLPSTELATIRGLLNAGRLPRLSLVTFKDLGQHGCCLVNGLLNALLDRANAPRSHRRRMALVKLSLRHNKLGAHHQPPKLLGAVLRALKDSLERLDVPSIHLTGKEDMRHLEDDFLHGLRSLSLLRSLAVGVADPRALTPLVDALTASGAAERLENLELELEPHVGDRSAHLLEVAISALPSLRSLTIKCTSLYVDRVSTRPDPIKSISRLSALQSLCIGELCASYEDVPVYVLEALSALTRLELRDDLGPRHSPQPPLPTHLLPKLATLHAGHLADRLMAQPGSVPSLTDLGYYPSTSLDALIRRRAPKLASLHSGKCILGHR